MRRLTLIALVALVVLAAGCGGGDSKSGSSKLPQGSEPVRLDPQDFTTEIDNPYWPMAPGSHWVYRETDAEGTRQRVDVTVTDKTETILGIEARVVHDVVTADGELVEDTFDWYAQDTDGSIWYLGENTKEYENDKLKSSEGSWRAGVDGAQPGIVVPGRPEVGMTYRQEYYEGHAEDAARILGLDDRVAVAYGSFDRVLMTKDSTPLDPEAVEYKFYARGVGPALVVAVSPSLGREELLRFTRGS